MWVSTAGKWLVVVGLVIAALGGLLVFTGKLFPSLGNLPGDIHVQGEKGAFHFPLVTCLLISAVLTLVVNLILRWFKG